MLQASLKHLMQRRDLDAVACREAIQAMIAAEVNPAQIAAFLVLLRSKGETADELVGCARALMANRVPVSTPHRVLDMVGTGGDGVNTVNISTGAAILAASCGVKILKSGNRAVSSLAGSADVLAALGVRIDLTAAQVQASIDEIGIGFCFAPNFHPALRQLRDLREQLRVPTTLNLLGPLLNPAKPAHVVLGVFDEALITPMAQALQQLGTQRSIVAQGCGLDEVSCVGPTNILEITPKGRHAYTIEPEQFGLARCSVADLRGGHATTNAALLLDVLRGGLIQKHPGIADTLILNAGVALYLYGLYSNLNEAVLHARDYLRSGTALTLLNHWIAFSHD